MAAQRSDLPMAVDAVDVPLPTEIDSPGELGETAPPGMDGAFAGGVGAASAEHAPELAPPATPARKTFLEQFIGTPAPARDEQAAKVEQMQRKIWKLE